MNSGTNPDDDFQLRPISAKPRNWHIRPSTQSASTGGDRVWMKRSNVSWKNPHIALFDVDPAVSPSAVSPNGDDEQSRPDASIATLADSTNLPRSFARIPRLKQWTRTFSVVALTAILIYLTLRFIALAFSSDEDFATELPGFFTYSILMISGTVLVTATLAGFIEFLELLLDVKSDLATARAMDRQL